MTENRDLKIIRSLLAFLLVAIAVSVIVIIIIVLSTGNATLALIGGVILFILVLVGKIIILDLMIKKQESK